MKATRKLIPAIVMLLVSAIVLSTASYAWFSMNTTVSATGMTVNATSAASLVISNAAPTTATTTTTVNLSSTAKTLTPATHNWTIGTATGLAYVSNLVDVNVNDGMAGAVVDSPVTKADDSDYYKDFVVYIAANGGAAIESDLKVKLTPPETIPAAILGAVAVDFYVGEVSSSAHKGTLHLDGKDTATEITLSGSVPAAVAAGTAYIQVTMRVYLDGAYEDSENVGYALVRNALANTADLVFGTEFYVE